MTRTNLQKQLDNLTGIGQDNQNEAMQPASETTESPATAKQCLLNRIGLIAILAVGVDATASFLKSKMERAAAVASRVVAAVLKSKKESSAIIVGLLPESPKKARLASVPLFALLTPLPSSPAPLG